MAGKTSEYYKSHPEARQKRVKQQAKINATPAGKKHRAECNAGRAKLGLKVGDKRDASHTKSGGIVAENRVTNRKRNGANKLSTKK